MCRVCHVPSLLCAGLSHNPLFVCHKNVCQCCAPVRILPVALGIKNVFLD